MTRRPVRIVVAAAVALALGMVAPGPRAGAQTPSFALLTPEEQMQYENVGSGAVRSIGQFGPRNGARENFFLP